MTIYDIAKEAGVAASTVSRVINNKPGIKKETREKIEKLLKKNNYIPNEAARGLVKQASKIIGILIVDIRVTHHIDSAYFIEQEMTKKGYCCITMSTGPSDDKKKEYIEILEKRRVEGAILMGSLFQTEEVKKSIKEHLGNIPVVMVNGYLDLPNVSGVIVDEDEGVKKCVELLASKGKKKQILLLDSESPSNLRKQEGFINGMKELGYREDEIIIFPTTESSPQGGYDATKAVLEKYPDTNGIICSIDLVAAGSIRCAHDLGIKVPEQLGIVGVDNSIYGELCMPKLTSLNNKLREVSAAAASILNASLDGEVHSQKMMLFSDIVEREST